MTSQADLAKANFSRLIFDRRTSFSGNGKARQIGACVGLLGGAAIFFGTIFLFAAEYIYDEKSHGVAMIFVAFALLTGGAHCLDKIEESEKFRRLEFCRRHGIPVREISIVAAKTIIKNS